jgi:[CysO sulfur-carrier protein]-S-L-cysteine hydrolase
VRHNPKSMEILRVSRDQLEQMIGQARADVPLETCGLLAGRDGRVTRVLPVPNILRSPVAYRMDGQALADAMVACDYEPLGIYHSHPAGPPVPSPTDVAESFYPDSVYVIISLAQEPPSVRAFRILGGAVTEVELQISDLFESSRLSER